MGPSCARTYKRRKEKGRGLPRGRLITAERSVQDDLELDAAVLRLAFIGLVGSDRLGLAVTLRGHARAFHALADQVLAHRLGALLRQGQFVGRRAGAVGVAADLDLDVGWPLRVAATPSST